MYFTGPSSSSFALVTSFNGVEAMTHTSPDDSLMAVERPPTGIIPKRAKGRENVHTSFATCFQDELGRIRLQIGEIQFNPYLSNDGVAGRHGGYR